MERKEIKENINVSIRQAKILLKDVEIGTDYELYTIYDKNYKIKPYFLEKERKAIVDDIIKTATDLLNNSYILAYHELTMVELKAEEQMKGNGNFKSTAAKDKIACVLVKEVLFHLENERQKKQHQQNFE